MTTQTPATAELEKWLQIRVRFFTNFWLRVRIRVRRKNRRILLESTPVIRIRSHLWQMSCPLAPSASKPLFSERHTFTDNFLWGPLWGVAKNNDKKYNRASILLLARENLNLLNRGNQEKICEFSTNVVVECGKIVTFLNVLRPGPQPGGGQAGSYSTPKLSC